MITTTTLPFRPTCSSRVSIRDNQNITSTLTFSSSQDYIDIAILDLGVGDNTIRLGTVIIY